MAAKDWVGVCALAASLCAVGCGSTQSKVGAPVTPVTLTLADSNQGKATEGVRLFAHEVESLSHGAVNIRLVPVDEKEPDYEQAIVDGTSDGRWDLAWVGGRALDVAGVEEAQALQVPFLIDSYEVEGKVLAGPVGRRIVADMRDAGVVGIGLLPDHLRYPVAVQAITEPAELLGKRFGAYGGQQAAARALGAIAVPRGGDTAAAMRAMARHAFDFIDSDPYNWRDVATSTTTMTVGAPLWPRTIAVFASPTSFHRLPAATRKLLREAAARAATEVLRALPASDQSGVVAICRGGGNVAVVSSSERAQFAERGSVTAEELSRRVGWAPTLDAIRALKNGSTPQPAPRVPADCAARRRPARESVTPAARAIGRRLAALLRPGSVWRARSDFETMKRVLGTDQARNNSGIYTFTFLPRNRFRFRVDGTYPEAETTVGGGPPGISRFRITGDVMHLTIPTSGQVDGHEVVKCKVPDDRTVDCPILVGDDNFPPPLKFAGTTGPMVRLRG